MVQSGNDDYESPKLAEITVSIVKEVIPEISPKVALPTSEVRTFESLVVEATRRFVTVIRHKTKQWDLDTRHPVHAYSYELWLGNTLLQKSDADNRRMPEGSYGYIPFSTNDFYEELSEDGWQEVVDEITRRPSISPQDELLADARALRAHLQYDFSVLYAAIASELILEGICRTVLMKDHGLNDRQCEAVMGRLNIPAILVLIHELNPNLLLDYAATKKLFEVRNKIAHGKSQNVSWKEASAALKTAEHTSQVLSGMLRPSK